MSMHVDYEDLISFGKHGKSKYLLLKKAMWAEFYRLSLKDRILVGIKENVVILYFVIGYIFAAKSFRDFFFVEVLKVFDLSAWAQDRQLKIPAFFGMTDADWKLALSVTFHGVLVFILVGCVLHLLFSKKHNTWAAKTATFLLGFLTKAVTTIA